MKFIVIIPSRYASTRFPGKPLVMLGGKTMIRRVYEQTKKSNLDEIIIATDDERINKEAKNFGAKCVMTSNLHQSGTDRCNEVVSRLDLNEDDVIINIQGDEPFIDPEQINRLRKCFIENDTTTIATLIKLVKNKTEFNKSSIIKVVKNVNDEAIYFSRTIIPYLQNVGLPNYLKVHNFYRHIGIYGYKIKTLKKIAALPPSTLEIAESLEQLRWLENGYKIMTAITTIDSISIDTPEDLERAYRLL